MFFRGPAAACVSRPHGRAFRDRRHDVFHFRRAGQCHDAIRRPAANEQAFSPAYLQSVSYRNADQRIEVLSRLPEVISGATNDEELFVRLISLLLTGIVRATAAAIVAVRGGRCREAAIDILHWDRRSDHGGPFSPSGRLDPQRRGERQERGEHLESRAAADHGHVCRSGGRGLGVLHAGAWAKPVPAGPST